MVTSKTNKNGCLFKMIKKSNIPYYFKFEPWNWKKKKKEENC